MKRLFRRFWVRLVLLLVADAALIGAGFCVWVLATLPQIPEDLEALSAQTGVNIYAHSGELLYTFNRQEQQVALESVSPEFVRAVIATEDADFYHHRGVSLKAVAGAFRENLRHLKKVRGGSTITQQIVKNLFLGREKTYLRKLKEALLAVQLEAMFRRRYGEGYKQKLLELYINGSFYGASAYGVEDAARTYFGRSASELTLREAAMLAGLPNAPSAFSPFREGDEEAARRTDHVLRRMHAAGFITRAELERALEAPLALLAERPLQNRTPYFVEEVKQEVARRWGRSALSFGALNIHTTLDLGLQRAAERAVAGGLADLDARLGFPPYQAAPEAKRADYVQGALVCLDPETGYVKAMVGGRDIFVSYYNRATTARRQPGSGFKPVVYLAALADGAITPVSLFWDEPRTYEVNRQVWTPKNFQDDYLGLTTAAWALVKSANATAVQVVYRAGPERVAAMGRRLGVASPLAPYPSIALGASEVTLLDLASAYATIANYGVRVEPTFVRLIENLEGRPLYRHRVQPAPVVDPADAYIMIRLLQNVVDRGTGRAVRAAGFTRPAAGKTGTTNDNTDAWFTGFTPGLVAGVWVGFDSRESGRLVERRTGRQITGGSGAAPIWAAFMAEATAGQEERDFWMPPGVREVVVDARTGVELDLEAALQDTDAAPIKIALKERTEPNAPDAVAAFLASQADTIRSGSVP